MTICGPLPAPTTGNAAVLSDYAGLSPVNDLSAYRDLFLGNPCIALVLDYENLPTDVRAAMWAQFAYAEANGNAGAAPAPAALHSNLMELVVPDLGELSYDGGRCAITRQEAVDIVAVKVAHMFKHEIEGTFPWSLLNYTYDEIRGLFHIGNMFVDYPDDYDWADEPRGYMYVVDHDHTDTYTLASGYAGSATTHREAIELLFQDAMRTLRHSATNDPRWAANPRFILETDAEHVSRRGCHTSCALVKYLCHSLNIPAMSSGGYFAGGAHAILIFPSVDRMLGHGDHFYTTELAQAPPFGLLDRLSDWDAIWPLDPFGQEASNATWRLAKLISLKYIPDAWVTDFTTAGKGWDSIRSTVEPYFPSEQWRVDKLYDDLVQITRTDGTPSLDDTTYFPVLSGGRRFTNYAGFPFFVLADHAESLFGQLSPNDALIYLNDVVAKGFNAIIVNLPEKHFTSNDPTWTNYTGASPFNSAFGYFFNITQIVQTNDYWTNAKALIDAALDRKILVIVAPAYSGLPGEGWLPEIQRSDNVDSVWTNYAGMFLGNFQNGHHNVITIIGGDVAVSDLATGTPTTVEAKMRQHGQSSSHLQRRVLWMGARNVPTSDYWDVSTDSWINVRTAYGDSDLYAESRVEFEATPELPVFAIKGVYENESGANAYTIRRQHYLAWLNGATAGAAYGNSNINHFGAGWQSSLNDAGRVQMKHMLRLAHSRNFSTLQPSYDASLLTSSRGTTGLDWTAVAMTTDTKTVMVYTAAARDITVDTRYMTAGLWIDSWWFDPSDGSAQYAGSTSNFSTTTRLHPGNNAAGDPDWVLIFDDNFSNFGIPGT